MAWCFQNRHEDCRREYQKFFIDHKNNLVWLDEFVNCECKKRSCKCYIKPADRVKKTTRRTRRKK